MTAGKNLLLTTHNAGKNFMDPAGKLLMPSSEVPAVMISPAMDLEIHYSAREYRDECRGHCHE